MNTNMNNKYFLRSASKCAVAIMLVASTLPQANAIDRFHCDSGQVPKFPGNAVTFEVDPRLYDNDAVRPGIERALASWSAATGWKFTFKARRGNGPGSFGDGVNQVRMDWHRLGTASNHAVPTSGPGQCRWYDNDIVVDPQLVALHMNRPNTNYIYKMMLHEMGHAIGMPHNNQLSIMNAGAQQLYPNSVEGLLGLDIEFIRDAYGLEKADARHNLRADGMYMQGGHMSYLFAIRSTVTGEGAWDFDLGDVVTMPYAITNEGARDVWAEVQFVVSPTRDMFDSRAVVLWSSYRYFKAGSTASSRRKVTIDSRDIPAGVSLNAGVRVARDVTETSAHDNGAFLGEFFLRQ